MRHDTMQEVLELFSALEEQNMLSAKEKSCLKNTVMGSNGKILAVLTAALDLLRKDVKAKQNTENSEATTTTTQEEPSISKCLEAAEGTEAMKEFLETIGVIIACYND